MVKSLQLSISILCVCVFSWINNYAQTLSSVQQALYYEYYHKANQLAAEQVLKDIEIGKSLFWQNFVALETGDSALLKLNSDRAKYIATNNTKWDPYLTLTPIFDNIYSNQSAKAKQLSDSVLKALNYKDKDLILALAAAFVAHPNHEAKYVLQILEHIPAKKRFTPHFYQIKGDAYRRLIQGGNAVSAYQKAIDIQDNYAKAYVSIARIYQTQNNHTLAIQFLEKAVDKDSTYGPAYFELFYSSYYSQPQKAKFYLEKFVEIGELSLAQLYMQMDFYYVQKQYDKSIEIANQIMSRQNLKIQPRVYKLKAYAYAGLKDSANATIHMEQYFNEQLPNEYIAKDYQFYAKLLLSQNKKDKSNAVNVLHHALVYANNKTDSVNTYYTLMSSFVNEQIKDSVIFYSEKIYQLDNNFLKAIDIYHWGLSYYQKEMYEKSDEVFSIYIKKYPNEVYGWLWKARSLSNTLESMYSEKTINAYKNIIEIGSKNLSRFQNILIQAHGYLGAYYANQLKEYKSALNHFQEILKIDPHHYDAHQYVDLLLEWTTLE